MALVISPALPLREWFESLDQQMHRSTGFFADRPVIVNLAAALEADEGLEAVLDALDDRNLRIIGIEGIDPAQLAGSRWNKLPNLANGQTAHGKNDRQLTVPDDPVAPVMAASPISPAGSLVIDRPVRSGQSIMFEDGDITIIGSVASGAEVIAGGSVHVYGALRGRAIAGFRIGAKARIFCQKLLAELISIDGLYYAPEHWGEGLHGRPVQIRLDEGALKFSALG